jgi:hypothetical protein
MARFLFLLTLSLVLTACVETKNVSIFAGSVAVVTEATGKMINADCATCANYNAMIDEMGMIRNKPYTHAKCEDLGKTLDAISALNTLLSNYGKALGNISQDTFTDYDSDEQGLKAVLQSLPAAQQPTQAQMDAVRELAGWLASLATQAQREKAVKAAMVGKNGEMRENFHITVALLRKLATQYSDGLERMANVTRMSLSLVEHDYAATEPVAVAEMKVRLSGSSHVSDEHKEAVRQYIAALDAMTKAFDAAAEKPAAREMLAEVRDFARQARNVYQSVSKAVY